MNGQRTDHLRNAEFEARRVAKRLTQAVGKPVDVTPVIAIVAARLLTIRERPERVVVLAAPRVPRWMQTRPSVLSADEIAELSRVVAAPSTWGKPVIPAADLAAFAELRTTVAAASKRRRGWALALVLSPLAFLITFIVGAVSLLL